ncbi:peptide deformylase [Wenxinia marina]|uniref:Peptide deformylase n=1 Tax=Wenxinia marina DSM 24838 TaxID=1123501 RepID=A0A0D0Q4P8_9RHOB|nr:peptide deformylase [Wenxinia marina]KIQ67527.1 peptide deformylase [Wenxinia marina DSM 24838]GGL68783.1 peptide deformylase [Wenxinia marina]
MLTIRTVPDPVLRELCAPVSAFDGALAALAWDMLRAMYAAPGRGLAAPQVGVASRLFVTDVAWKEGAPDPRVFANPEILSVSEEMEEAEEGCLSIPGVPCLVRRPVAVRLRWQGLDGAGAEDLFEGWAARCVLHEYDHLDGILCTDRVQAA